MQVLVTLPSLEEGRDWGCRDPSKGGWLLWTQALGQQRRFIDVLPAPICSVPLYAFAVSVLSARVMISI